VAVVLGTWWSDWRIVVSATAVALLILGVALAEGDASQGEQLWFAGLAAAALLVAAIWGMRLAGITPGGLVIGKDERLSTSKLQAFVWTVVLAWILLSIVIADFAGAGAGLEKLLGDDGVPEEYLILLGGPFAAAVASKAIVSDKVGKGTLAKQPRTTAASRRERVGEAFSDDRGNADLIDSQYLLFNLVALVYVIGGFVSDPTLGVPEIPDVLVALTGISAATYVSNKAVAAEQAELTAVIPARGRAGDPVQVFGRNLLVPHPTEERCYEQVYVLFAGREAKILGVTGDGRYLRVSETPGKHEPIHESSADDRLWVEVPEGLGSEPVTVRVRNFRGVVSRSQEDVRFRALQ
jgi:hypothetical protein